MSSGDGVAQRIILASGSPTRRKLLTAAGVVFDVVPSTVDEVAIRAAMTAHDDCVEPADVALELAAAKAIEVSEHHPEALVIGADQVLALGSRIFEKPADVAAARETIARLNGRTHELLSAFVLAENGIAQRTHVERARLTMRRLTDPEINRYLAQVGTGVCHAVGAYELEGPGLQLFEAIDGDYFTILGLPMLPLLANLRTLGALP